MESLQIFLDGLEPASKVSVADLDKLRLIFRPFVRYCPLRKGLVSKLEECAERVMRFEEFDSDPAKESPSQACSLEKDEWWGPWV